VVPALMRKIDAAKRAGAANVEIWGSGTPKREFLYVDDLADACVFLLKHYSGHEHINVGTGEDLTIRELAETIAKVIGYSGGFVYDRSKPDGTPRKLVDVTKLTAIGWRPRIALEDGIREVYRWYQENGPDRQNS
jgi:GDP-L-fucose synthase